MRLWTPLTLTLKCNTSPYIPSSGAEPTAFSGGIGSLPSDFYLFSGVIARFLRNPINFGIKISLSQWSPPRIIKALRPSHDAHRRILCLLVAQPLRQPVARNHRQVSSRLDPTSSRSIPLYPSLNRVTHIRNFQSRYLDLKDLSTPGIHIRHTWPFSNSTKSHHAEVIRFDLRITRTRDSI